VSRVVLPPPPPTQVIVGRRAQEALLNGEQLSDADTACLVADAIMKIQEGYTAWQGSTGENGAPAVDGDGKATHPQVHAPSCGCAEAFRYFGVATDLSASRHC